jgi:hypothetical protein
LQIKTLAKAATNFRPFFSAPAWYVLEQIQSRIWTYFLASPSYRSRVRYRWLRVPDLNLHLDFQERMITADSLSATNHQQKQSLKMETATSAHTIACNNVTFCQAQ